MEGEGDEIKSKQASKRDTTLTAKNRQKVPKMAKKCKEVYITLTFSAKIVWCTLANPTHVSSMVRTLLSVLNIALKLEEQKILSLVNVFYCLTYNQGL